MDHIIVGMNDFLAFFVLSIPSAFFGALVVWGYFEIRDAIRK